GEHHVAYLRGVGVTNRHRRKICALDFQERQVARLVRAHELRLQGAAVVEFDADIVSGIDHMVVREDVTIRADDHAGAQPTLAERLRSTLSTAAAATPVALIAREAELIAEEAAQHVFVVVAATKLGRARLGLAFDLNGDYTGSDDLHDVGV